MPASEAGPARPAVPAAAVRPARPGDVPVIARMIRDLAAYENAPDEVTVTPDDLGAALFGPQPSASAHVAEYRGTVAGFALWFVAYSTWTGPGIYLEDLYVDPAARRAGLARALVAELARVCVARGYARLQWAVLDWNAPAHRFYDRLGAQTLGDWRLRRLSGDALRALADGP